ncbi:unnamed protein product [Lupinus luteus]|uniref:Uncharacterized protein n=1 Tax=Lupinus luteus TaxID=3873 RepID=A0AAV1W1Z5_LUPLU
MHLRYLKNTLILDFIILLFKTLTSCIIFICLTLFDYIYVIAGSYSLLCLFFCLYYVYSHVCYSWILDIH